MKTFLWIGAVLFLGGCATSPVSTGQAQPVPDSRMLAQQWRQAATGTGQLILKRDSGFTGSGCTIRVFVDANPAVDIETSEVAVLHLPGGDHILSATTKGMLCPGAIVEASVNISPETVRRFRAGLSQSMDLVLQPTAF